MEKIIRIGTRESQLAVWQASLVKEQLFMHGFKSELVYIKSEGDIDLSTPLYEIGVQGIFTKSLDIALLNGTIDIAVHSMKDVPTQLAKGVVQAAVLSRGNYKDILVYKDDKTFLENNLSDAIVATSSLRRKAQWLNKYPNHQIENLRGNVNTRLKKVAESSWNGAIFAAAGVERISVRPENSVDLDWMLPAPAQGAIMIACKENDTYSFDACHLLNDKATSICTKIERDFLRALLGGCSTPIAAIAKLENDQIIFEGNILTLDGKEKASVSLSINADDKNINDFGKYAAEELLLNGGSEIVIAIKNATK
ncbi:hydroxymethylbilane synthase [Ferruginibacter sp. SUN002]|uniref:hydroxymethylbilane synthase n=1 Tax=Ferruginibacter sp. SUN002 TaxID=2937789 RepID=UPI003D35AC1B